MFDEMPDNAFFARYFSKALWSWRPFHFLMVLALLLASCAGDGCDCAGFEARPYPVAHYNKTVPVSGQVRITKGGLDFLGNEMPTLITSVMPDGLNFCLPRSAGGEYEMCLTETCDDGMPGCQLSMTLEETKLTPQPVDKLILGLTIGDVDDQLSIKTKMMGIKVDCDVKLGKKGALDQPARIPATIPIQLKLDNSSPTKDIQIGIGEIDANLDELDFKLSGNLTCAVGQALRSFFINMLKEQIISQLNGMVGSMLDSQLCQTCGDGLAACPGNSSCNVDEGVCRYNATQECVARMLGVEGGLMLSQLLSGYSQSEDASVDVMVRAADKFKVDDGLTLGLRTGFQPEEFSRCAPVDPTSRPAFTEIPFSPTITGNVRPGSGTPFMLGFGLHQRALEHMMWSTWASGGLCLKVSSDTIDMLSTTAIGLFVPSVSKLADGNRALYIQLAPQKAPNIVLGANKIRRVGSKNEIEEGLFTLDWKDVDIHMYGFVQERFVRLFTLRSDLLLPIAVSPGGNGELQIAIGDIEKAIKNIRPIAHGLMAEDNEKLESLLPKLMGLALPMLGDMLNQSFALPDVMGYSIVLEQNDITSVDNNTFIALFADLKKSTSPMVASVTGVVQDYRVDVSNVLPSGMVRPVVTLDVVGVNDMMSLQDADELEFSYRLNNGFWSLYQPTSKLMINDPVLALQGEHVVEVRARFAGRADSAQIVPTRMPVIVDFSAPTLSIERSGSHWKLLGEDVTDRAEHLSYRYRVVGGGQIGDWSVWSSADVVELDERKLPETFRIEAEVRDRAGYEGRAEYTVHNKALEPALVDSSNVSSTGCGCAATGMGGQSGNLVAFLLLGLGLVIRRRVKALAKVSLRKSSLGMLLVVCMALVFVAGCSDAPSGSTDKQKCEEGCLDGFVCRSGMCVPQACSQDTDCASGICRDGSCKAACDNNSECSALDCGADQVGVCSAGGCECQDYCGGQSCGDGKFCCHNSNSCQALPDACAGVTCDKGMGPVVKNTGMGDSATCEVNGADCACEKLPPLAVGWHGAYASVASNSVANVTAAAVYNSTYHDLMVATLDSSLKPTWYTVDGIPANGEVAGALDGPRGGIREIGVRVGMYTATVVDNSGNLHVFYRDTTNKALKYARGTNNQGSYSFVTTTLDAEGDAGYWNSALLVDDAIHLVYTAREGTDKSEIRTLHFEASTAIDALPTTSRVLYRSTVILGPDEQPAAVPGYVKSTGLFNQLTKTPEGMLLVFYDHNLENVAWIEHINGDWELPQFLGIPSGPYVSGAIDASGKLHLAYMDTKNPALVYWTQGAAAQVIMDGKRDDAEGWVLSDIGEGVSLRLIGDGRVQVMFQDTTRHVLYTSTLTANGWAKSALAAPGSPYSGARGFFGTMISNAGASIAVEYVINNQGKPATAFPVFHRLN